MGLARYTRRVRTVLTDRGESLFELPTWSADEREWFEDFNRLRCVYDPSRVKIGKSLDGIASRDALSKIDDIVVGT
jgi:hypothetical protein